MKRLFSLHAVRDHLRNPQSDYRQIAVDFLKISLFVFAGKLIGGLKEIVVAWRYGVGEVVDAYTFVFNLTVWPQSIVASILGVILIPLFIRMRGHSPEEVSGFTSEFLGLMCWVGVVIWFVMVVGLPLLLQSGWAGLKGDSLLLAQDMAFPLTCLIPLGFVSAFLSVQLMSHGLHRNTFFEAMPALTILIALLMISSQGWQPLVWGTVLGFLVQCLCLLWPARQTGELRLPVFTRRSPAWSGLWGGVGIMAAGQVLMSLTSIMDQFFVARLQVGDLAVLGYANRIMALILGLGATAVGRATLPVFSRVETHHGNQALRAMALRWTWSMFGLGVVGCLVLWAIAPFLVRLLFERGAFGPEDTQAVCSIFRILVLQLPFYLSGIVLTSLFSCKKAYTVFFLGGLLGILLKCLANFILVPLYGLVGIAAAFIILYLVNNVFLLSIIKNVIYK